MKINKKLLSRIILEQSSNTKNIEVIAYNNQKIYYSINDIKDFADNIDSYWNSDNLPKWMYVASFSNKTFPKNKNLIREFFKKMITIWGGKKIVINVDSKLPGYKNFIEVDNVKVSYK